MSSKTLREAIVKNIFSQLFEADTKKANPHMPDPGKFVQYDADANKRAKEKIGDAAGKPDKSSWRFTVKDGKWMGSKGGKGKLYDLSKFSKTTDKLNAAFGEPGVEVVKSTPKEPEAGKDSPEKKAEKQTPDAAVGGVFVEKYKDSKGRLLKKREFGYYKLKRPVPLQDASASWLLDKSLSRRAKNRRKDDMVTHVQIKFSGKTELTPDNIRDAADQINFRLGRAGMGGSADHKGGRTREAAALANKMLKLAGFKLAKVPVPE